MKISKRFDAFYMVLLLFISGLVFVKAYYINSFIDIYTNSQVNAYIKTITNDGGVYAVSILCLYVSFIAPMPRYLSIFLRSCGFLIIFFYVLDIIIFSNFHTRLVGGDVVKYGRTISYIFNLHYEFILFVPAAFLLLVGTNYRIKAYRTHLLSIVLISLFLGGTYVEKKDDYVHAWIYDNFIKYNRDVALQNKPYNDVQPSNINTLFPKTCTENIVRNKPNIIILMVESLSAYHSDFFSGIYDWTPNLDHIANEHKAFLNMFANGYNTEDAEVSLLTGELPISPPNTEKVDGNAAFAGFYNFSQSLPIILRGKGYSSEFLTSASLGFSKTGEWLESIGFDYIEGHDHKFYEGWERYVFKAAPDEALYHRVLDRVQQERQGRYFMFVKTASTHHPFIDPDTKIRSEEKAVEYADRQIGFLYKELKRHKFFDNGILIITGDHRTMTAIKPEELVRYGSHRAAAKVPAVIVSGDNVTAQHEDFIQHSDIYNGLKNMVGPNGCYSAVLGDPFVNPPVFPKYVLHKQGARRGTISVFGNNIDASVQLNGDDTDYVLEPDFSGAKSIIDYINTKRLEHSYASHKK